MFLLVGMVIFLFVVLQGVTLMPAVSGILKAKHAIMLAQAEGFRKIPDIEGRISTLDKRTLTLTSENIEARLGKIETAIKVGQVNPETLSSLQELRNDFNALKTYMFSDPDKLVELRTLQNDYQQLKQAQSQMITKEAVSSQINSTKDLFWISLGLHGILFTIMIGALGTWFTLTRPRRNATSVAAESRAASGEAQRS
jgi:hypothetical protein